MITDESPMPWGKKHKGVKMANVPPGYLLWVLEQLRAPSNNRYGNRDLLQYLEDNEDVLKAEMKKQI